MHVLSAGCSFVLLSGLCSQVDVEDVFYEVIMEFCEEHMEDWDADFGQRQEIEEFWVYLELTYIVKKTRLLFV